MTAGLAFLTGLALGAALTAAWGAYLDRRRSRRLERFFSHAAHEINTPITAINITVLNLLDGVLGDIPPGLAKWIDMMREQVGRLNGLIGELRDLIHVLLSRDLLLQLESVAPAELAAGALAAVKRGLSQIPVEVRLDVSADLPRVRVDRDRTVRTLTSLLFHARKFRTSGDMRICADRMGEAVRLHLQYQGLPLPPGESERSLDLLYPASARGGHTLDAVGLGLGVLRVVARRQGGDLGFQVGPDGRAELTLCVPVSPR